VVGVIGEGYVEIGMLPGELVVVAAAVIRSTGGIQDLMTLDTGGPDGIGKGEGTAEGIHREGL
jgi:hypothetical protein